ncbi:MAG: homoprotocatechuate degradation operon regulator HpaR [Pseudomonadota bacterium]|nr:homoprotocatechuate degradation operon regulator HpaR [Pseudomonadota bacterium]
MPDTPDSHRFSPTRQSLPIMLLRAREAVMARYRPMLREIGVTEQQWRVLRVLKESGEIDVSTLAERAAILGPSLTRILKTLRETGLVDVRQDRDDRRRSLASLTDAGDALVVNAADDSADVYAEISTQFGYERTQALIRELDALLETLGQPD